MVVLDHPKVGDPALGVANFGGNIDHRYASAHELAIQLEKIAKQEGIEIALADRSTRTRRPRDRRKALQRWLSAAAAAAVILTALPATRTVLFSALGIGGGRTYRAVVPFTPGDNVIAAGLTVSLTAMIAQLANTG